jgi:hypothetical protein
MPRGAGAIGWVDAGDLSALAGDVDGAAFSYIQGLPGAEAAGAADRLARLVNDGALTHDLASSRITGSSARESAEGMRLLCEWGLRYRADRDAVRACQAFGRRHPSHPSVRTLALAAGRIAEHRLHDDVLAIEEYSRAVLVSRFAGVATTEALFSRSRCQARRGQLDEARADLRLFLSIEPESSWRPEVAELTAKLGIDARGPAQPRK